MKVKLELVLTKEEYVLDLIKFLIEEGFEIAAKTTWNYNNTKFRLIYIEGEKN